MPLADLSFSFSRLSVDNFALSPETYYVKDGDIELEIISCTWTPSGSDVWIAFYNVDDQSDYGLLHTGGHISDFVMVGTSAMPDGNYKIMVKNEGPVWALNGAIQYDVNNEL